MTGSKPPPTTVTATSGSFKHIGNKVKRTDLYRKYKAEKKKEKIAKRVAILKEERGEGGAEKKKARLEANKPRTIENTRDYNPTIISAPNTHEGPGPSNLNTYNTDQDATEEEVEVHEQEALEEEDDDEDPHAPPAILITTSMPSNSTTPHLDSLNARCHPAENTRLFINELLNIFPGAEYRPRSKAQGAGLGKICGWARDRRYGAVIVVGESKKEPFALTMVSLPKGPTAFFRLTSITMGPKIYGKAKPTPHTPELILNNFTTVLGHQIGGLLQSLFPKIPQLEGRQVVTCHNQRDYIFFRRHRYMFKSDEKTALQEIGPKFTLKLHSLKDSLPKGAGVWDGKYQGEFAEIEPDAELDEETLAPIQQDDQASGESNAEGGSHLDTNKSKPKKRDRGEEEVSTAEFKWQPKMSVSKKNFYL